MEEPKRDETLIGWVIPFEANNTYAFAVIDANDFSTSIHFVKENDKNWFLQINGDDWSPGKKVTLVEMGENKINHIHTDGLHMYWEDIAKRLVPTLSANIKEIDKLLEEALNQARERVVKSQEVRRENSENTKRTLLNFSKGLD